jgi:L-iditol 2-dehydrogenase
MPRSVTPCPCRHTIGIVPEERDHILKAAVLTGIRGMEIRDIPDISIAGDLDVLIRMAQVGVCGSDVHYYTTGRIGSQVVRYPFAIGHEGAGVVEAVGAKVSRVKPGDRIAVDPAISCFTCDQCLAGRPHTCRKLLFLGCPGQVPGCFSEYLVMPEESCYPLDSRITLTQAALSEPLAIGVYAVRQSIPMPGASVGILGAGPIGLSVLAAAIAEGAGSIYVTDKINARLAVAMGAGATMVVNPVEDDAVTRITEREPRQLDVVFECCGKQEALDQGVDLLKPGGKLMMVGIPEVDRVSFSIDSLRRKEVCLQNVRRQVHCVEPTLGLIASGTVNVDYMVTHRFPLDRCQEAFDLVADYRDGVVKAMIEISGED